MDHRTSISNQFGQNCVISPACRIGSGVTVLHNCIIEDDVTIGDGTYIDSNTIIRKGTSIGTNSYVGSNCIIGECQVLQGNERKIKGGCLSIGNDALIRSGSIIYSGSMIGDSFQTGHQVTIREKSRIGGHVSIGTLSDVQGHCRIGNYVRLHSNVHIGQESVIDDFVWIFPYVILTNDPTPPSEQRLGVHIHSFAVIAAGSVVMAGIEIGQDSLIGAGAVVTKDVQPYKTVVGNPGKEVADVRSVRNKKTGEAVYPWRYHYTNGMPWEYSDFDTWRASIEVSDRQRPED